MLLQGIDRSVFTGKVRFKDQDLSHSSEQEQRNLNHGQQPIEEFPPPLSKGQSQTLRK